MDNQSIIKATLEKYQGNTVLVDDYHPGSFGLWKKKKQISIMDTIARCIDEEETAMPIVTAEFREGSFSVQDRQVQIEIGDTQLQWELLRIFNRIFNFIRHCCIVSALKFIREKGCACNSF